MNRRLAILPILALLGLAAAPAVAAEPPAAKPAAPPTTAERPLTALPYTPSLDASVMDRAVDPCVDLYTFSCGKWLEKNPIPADRPAWSVYAKTGDDNRRFLWGMLEAASRPAPGRDANTQKIGDYFAACMDETAVEKAGAGSLKADLAAVAGLKSKADLPALLSRLHLEGESGSALFGFGSGQNPQNASQVIGVAAAGGLGLPSPEDYIKDDAKSKEAREHYRAYVQKIFELLGDPQPARDMEAVLRVETDFAKRAQRLRQPIAACAIGDLVGDPGREFIQRQ